MDEDDTIHMIASIVPNAIVISDLIFIVFKITSAVMNIPYRKPYF